MPLRLFLGLCLWSPGTSFDAPERVHVLVGITDGPKLVAVSITHVCREIVVGILRPRAGSPFIGSPESDHRVVDLPDLFLCFCLKRDVRSISPRCRSLIQWPASIDNRHISIFPNAGGKPGGLGSRSKSKGSEYRRIKFGSAIFIIGSERDVTDG